MPKQTFVSAHLGFLFWFEGMSYADSQELYEAGDDRYFELQKLNTRIYHALGSEVDPQSLVNSPEWKASLQLVAPGEAMHVPYVVCEDGDGPTDFEGKAAFSFWIYSEVPLSDVVIKAMKEVVLSHYAEAAADAGVDCKFIGIELQNVFLKRGKQSQENTWFEAEQAA